MTTEEYNLAVDRYADGIYRFAVKTLSDSDRAQDIVQDTFEKLWTRADTVDFGKVKSYLFTTAYHTMVDHLRREKRMTYPGQIPDMQSYSEEYNNLHELLEMAITRLPEDQRMVLMLRDYEGYSYRDIEEITGLGESQVKVYIFRARLFLKQQIQRMEELV